MIELDIALPESHNQSSSGLFIDCDMIEIVIALPKNHP
jgi:hypothetical protein